MHAVYVEAENTRLYGIDHDPEGALWFTGSRPILHRYWPRQGRIESFEIPPQHGGSQCLWAAGKVFILPQIQPRMVVYDVAAGRGRHLEKPFPEANLWYGRSDPQRSLLMLDERSRPCLALLDADTEQWQVEPYPVAGALPDIREIQWSDALVSCFVPQEPERRWVFLDPDARRFVAEYRGAYEPVRPGTETTAPRYVVRYADGRMTRTDRLTGEVHTRDIPGWGTEFGFIGGGVFWRGWQLNNLSTYANTYRYDERTGQYIQLREDPDRGVDGHPYHFMDRFLAYHPESDTFSQLIPEVPEGRYPQLCYNHVAGDELYITSNDIWSPEKGRPLGATEGPIGQVMVLQSHPVERVDC
jgi:hypothetical protein